jgi:hypothetical protein
MFISVLQEQLVIRKITRNFCIFILFQLFNEQILLNTF